MGSPFQGYEMPQGIDVNLLQSRSLAVPRKTGAYDMEGLVASTVPASTVFFQSSTGFNRTLSTLTSKAYGRDTNITSKTGGMARGERLYAYGLSAKIDAGDATLNSAANIVMFDQWRRLWGISHILIKLGGDEFVVAQARDVPLQAPKILFHTFSDTLAPDISVDGMYDLTVAGDPYIFDQQEDFRIEFNTSPQNLTLTVETHLTIRIEGVRIKALRA